jgi:hypothetical protein
MEIKASDTDSGFSRRHVLAASGVWLISGTGRGGRR